MLTWNEILLVGFVVAFFVVEARPRIKLFDRKPLKCMPCMTAWATFGAAIANGEVWWMCGVFLCAGYTVGAIFSAIKMRWL